MDATCRPSASLATKRIDTETLALLEAVEVPLPDFASLDLDTAFGTPTEMYEAGSLLHERLDGLDITAAAIEARETCMLAGRGIVALDPTATELVRRCLVNVLIPDATQLHITRPAAATVFVPLAA